MKHITDTRVDQKLEQLLQSFRQVLYQEDKTFLKNMNQHNLASDDIKRYHHWEWPQGVGLFGIWRYYKQTGDLNYLHLLEDYYARQCKVGFPAKNVNTTAPMLTLAYYAHETCNHEYIKICFEWADYIMHGFPKTPEGGLQHITSDSINQAELWDDTLFMTVLFLAAMGQIHQRVDYQQEAVYQFLLHTKYLQDSKTGLWYHGWTFQERNHFSGAFWGRGNCWITSAIPELLQMDICPPETRRFLIEVLKNQVDALRRFQEENGMWHTLIDDRDSYLESSATAGFGYGILRAVNLQLLDSSYLPIAQRAVHVILKQISADGIVKQVSYGTAMGRDTKEFYKQIPLQPMPYGQALAMLLLMEWRNQNQEG